MLADYKELFSKLSDDKKEQMIEILVGRLTKHDPSAVNKLLEDLEGQDKYNNYISEDEYRLLSMKLINQDKTTGPKFHNTLIESSLVKSNLACYDAPKYNKWALMLTINYMSAVYYKFTAEIASKLGVHQIIVCYNMAVAKLSDLNCPKWIREYFKL
jgi:hypothetical protein